MICWTWLQDSQHSVFKHNITPKSRRWPLKKRSKTTKSKERADKSNVAVLAGTCYRRGRSKQQARCRCRVHANITRPGTFLHDRTDRNRVGRNVITRVFLLFGGTPGFLLSQPSTLNHFIECTEPWKPNRQLGQAGRVTNHVVCLAPRFKCETVNSACVFTLCDPCRVCWQAARQQYFLKCVRSLVIVAKWTLLSSWQNERLVYKDWGGIYRTITLLVNEISI